jgi:hypothetical protein
MFLRESHYCTDTHYFAQDHGSGITQYHEVDHNAKVKTLDITLCAPLFPLPLSVMQLGFEHNKICIFMVLLFKLNNKLALRPHAW